MNDLRNQTSKAQDAITKDESSLRAIRQAMLIRRNQIVELLEALDKAIKAGRPKENK